MDINELVERSHRTACDKGWWEDAGKSPLEVAALFHSEISEFVEDMRNPDWHTGAHAEKGIAVNVKGKPIGPLSECADILIRVADYCGKRGWDLNGAVIMKSDYNDTRDHRHGGKKF